MSLAHVIVDVFTDTPLQGNQLAVFEDGSVLSDDQMPPLDPQTRGRGHCHLRAGKCQA